MSERRHHRPALPGSGRFEEIEAGVDPAKLHEAGERVARAMVRGPHDDEMTQRVVRLADEEGLETLADLWAGAPYDSLAGAVWRLYLLRQWVHSDPAGAAAEFDRGRTHAPVAEAIAGVEVPPGPDEVRRLVDAVLAGVAGGDFAGILFRAAAFARITAAGRAAEGSGPRAARLMTMAEQLEQAGRLELAHELG